VTASLGTRITALRAAPPRTWLFVPGSRCADLFPKALKSGAGAIIIDLEDSVATEQRAAAHAQVRSLRIGSDPPIVFLRVNSRSRETLHGDVELAVSAQAHGVMLPKVRDASDITYLASLLTRAESLAGVSPLAIVPLIETPLGLARAVDIGLSHNRVACLALGAEDLAVGLGAQRSRGGSEIATARALVVIAAGAAGCGAIDTPWLDLRDPAGAAEDARHACALGFAGKLLLHPSQVKPVSDGFAPSPAEVRQAAAVIDAFDRSLAEGNAVIVVDGRVVDEPVVRAARRVLARNGDSTNRVDPSLSE